jgi:hypothetical protein
MSRRRFLSAAASLTVVPAVVHASPPATPDAELLSACDRYTAARAEDRRLLAHAWAMDHAGDHAAMQAADAAWEAGCNVTETALDLVVATPALTLPGALAKAGIIHDYRLSLRGPNEVLNFDETAVDALMADLLRLNGGAA